MFNQFYLVIIFGLLAIWFSCKSNSYQQNMRGRKIACVLLCIFFVVQAGCRDYINQINDTLNYANSYNQLKSLSISDIINNISFSNEQYSGRDPGYRLFVKLTQLIIPDFRFFLIIVAVIISVPLCRIFYKYCTSLPGIFIAACLYEALFENFFETGIRQTISMGLSFMALEKYQGGKYLLTILLSLLAFSIHSTALIFIPVYFLLKYKHPRKFLVFALLLAPVFMMFSKEIMFIIGEGTIMSHYTSLMTTDNKGTPVFSALVVLAVMFTNLYANKIKKNYRYFNLMFIVMACAIMFLPSTWVNSNFVRIEFYFLVFLMPLISVFVDVLTNRNLAQAPKYYLFITLTLAVLTYN